MPGISEKERDEMSDSDWKEDSKGQDGLNFSMFFDAVFDLIDGLPSLFLIYIFIFVFIFVFVFRILLLFLFSTMLHSLTSMFSVMMILSYDCYFIVDCYNYSCYSCPPNCCILLQCGPIVQISMSI